MGFAIEKLFLFITQSFLYLSCRNKVDEKVTSTLSIIGVTIAFGQSKYITKSGSMSFEASQPTFEPIEATHSAVSALLNADTGELAVLALVRGFPLSLALMEEHFNENYIESHQYPKTSFKGSITDFDQTTLSDQPQTVELTGELSMHGVTKAITVC